MIHFHIDLTFKIVQIWNLESQEPKNAKDSKFQMFQIELLMDMSNEYGDVTMA